MDVIRHDCGAVLFDNPGTHQSAWACRAGEKAQRVDSIDALPTDTVWWTNIPREVMYQKGMLRDAYFRHARYPGESMETILDELGLQGDHSSPRERTRILANLFERIMGWTYHFLGLTKAPLQALKRGIRRAVMPPDPVYGQAEKRYVDAMTESTQHATFTRRTFELENSREDKEIVPFVIPRWKHALKMLEIPRPAGGWTEIPEDEYPGSDDSADIQAWCTDREHPALLDATVSNVDPQYGDLLHIGGGAPPESKGYRGYFSIPELAWVCQLADVDIHEGIESKTKKRVPNPLYRHPDLNGYEDWFESDASVPFKLSYSFNLFAHALWKGVSTKSPDQSDSSEGVHSANPLAPFMKAYDRMSCFEKAIILEDQGLTVTLYTTGKIYVEYTESMNPRMLAEAAARAGLIPPSYVLGSEDPVPGNEQRSNPTVLMQEFHARGETEEILDKDQRVVESIVQGEDTLMNQTSVFEGSQS